MTLIYFILIIGITVFIHEFGHFIFAKKAGIYVYEFCIGMGPKLFKFRRKNDETEYSIALLPIGGYVQLAGEEIEADKNIPEEKRIQTKTWFQRFMTMFAGILFNFILGIVILFIIYLISGVPSRNMMIKESSIEGLSVGSEIVKINNYKVSNYDMLTLRLQMVGEEKFNLTVKNSKGELETFKTKMLQDKEKNYYYEFKLDSTREKGLFISIKAAFKKFFSMIQQMIYIIFYLITGKLSLSSLSGPIGIFNAVGEYAKMGFLSLLSLLSLITINVGFINLLPIPAFDGGRILFLIIEKIKGSPINPKIENIVHTVGFVLLMILMVIITFSDITRIF